MSEFDINEFWRMRAAEKEQTLKAKSVLLWLLACNLPLSYWPKYINSPEFQKGLPGFMGEKELNNAARLMVNALTQEIVQQRMAEEWEFFPPRLRQKITAIANEARNGHCHISNNVTKGIVRFNDRLGGKILARQTGPTERTLQIVGGRKVSVDRRINPAVAGAYRAFSGYAFPPNFSNMSKAEQKKVRQQLAAERRELKRQ